MDAACYAEPRCYICQGKVWPATRLSVPGLLLPQHGVNLHSTPQLKSSVWAGKCCRWHHASCGCSNGRHQTSLLSHVYAWSAGKELYSQPAQGQLSKESHIGLQAVLTSRLSLIPGTACLMPWSVRITAISCLYTLISGNVCLQWHWCGGMYR